MNVCMYCREKFGPGKNWTSDPIFSMKKVDPLYQKLSGHIRLNGLYITEQCYPPDCSQDKKRAIRKKAAMFNVRKGVLFIKKKKKSGVRPDFS